MPRDARLLDTRNKELLADYNRLKAEEQRFRLNGRVFYMRLTPTQIIQALSKLHHLSPRRVEVLVYAAKPKPAPLSAAA
jgi:hypothetical protein